MSTVGTLQASAADLISSAYTVTVNGKNVPVYACRVSAMPFNRTWPGHQRTLDQTEEAAYVNFDLPADGTPVTVVITAARDFGEAILRPLSRKVDPWVEGNTVSFTLTAPGQFSLELDGRHGNLHIFANPARQYDFDPRSCTYYFGPGVHEMGEIELRSGETLFVDEGALVFGAVRAENAEKVGIYGRGVIDYSHLERHVPLIWKYDGILNFVECRDVTVEGVTLAHSSWWNMTAFNCVGMEFKNVKVIGAWRYNTDGFDFVNSQNLHVDGCFLRTYDDTVVLKGLYIEGENFERMSVTDVLVENCVLWCDWGGALEIGAETVADEYRNIVYRNIDVIRNADGAMRIQAGDRADIHDLHYENIRVEYAKYDRPSVYQKTDDMVYAPEDKPALPFAINGWMYCGTWSPYNIPGQVHDVSYKDIAILTDEGVECAEYFQNGGSVHFAGADAEHTLRDVKIEGITLNGKPFLPKISKNEFVHNVTVTDLYVELKKNTVSAAGQLKPGQDVLFETEEFAGKHPRVLFVGNSITLHGPLAAIGWNNMWGMAASSADKDYVHLVMEGIRKKRPDATFCIAQAADWERRYNEDYDLTKFSNARLFNADLIVLRLVENCPHDGFDADVFKASLGKLVEYLNPEGHARVVVTTGFWRHPGGPALAAFAGERNLPCAALEDLGDRDDMKAIGLFEHGGVANHPGDLGMETIAERIFGLMKPLL